MEARRKPAVCLALLVLLFVASSAAVSAAQLDERCWKDDDHHTICLEDDCRATCQDHGHKDGRCSWAWYLKSYCQCLVADCKY